MKRTLLMLLLIGTACLAGCGAASAPPVDLPAPVVGRVTVGSPDASGKSTISGTPGAVEGGAIVMATNERLAGTASLMWKVSDALMPAAYAQSLPAICSFLGHACTVALADGSFVLIIDASIGDSITLVLIDASGAEISSRITIIIPSTTLSIGVCGTEGVTGTMKDIANFGGTAVMLFEGSSVAPNTLMIETTEVPLPGCYARTLALLPTGATTGRAAILSSTDKIVWTSLWSAGTLIAPSTHTIPYEPLGGTFIDNPDKMILVVRTASGLVMGTLSFGDGVFAPAQAIPLSQSTDEVLTVRALGPFGTTGGYLIAVINYATTVPHTYRLTFFESIGLTNITANVDHVLKLAEYLGVDANVLEDAALVTDVQRLVYLVVSDSALKTIHFRSLSGVIDPLSLSDDISLAGISNLISPTSMAANVPNTEGYAPKKIALGSLPSTTILSAVYATTSPAGLWRISEIFTLSPIALTFPVAGLEDPVAIAIDGSIGSVLIGDNISKKPVDASSLWLVP